MSTSPEIRRRKYSVFVLAIIVLLLGGAALFFGSNNPMMLALGGLMCVLSAYLVKLSNVHGKETVFPSSNLRRRAHGHASCAIRETAVPCSAKWPMISAHDAIPGTRLAAAVTAISAR